MKKLLVVLLSVLVVSGYSASAQFGGMQRATAEERVMRITQKLDSAFKLDAPRMSVVDTALKVLFRAQDAKRQELMGGGQMPDREQLMAEMKKFTDAQDEILGAVLSKDEFQIWKEKIQPSMRSRGMGGPGGPGGGQGRERNNQ